MPEAVSGTPCNPCRCAMEAWSNFNLVSKPMYIDYAYNTKTKYKFAPENGSQIVVKVLYCIATHNLPFILNLQLTFGQRIRCFKTSYCTISVSTIYFLYHKHTIETDIGLTVVILITATKQVTAMEQVCTVFIYY